MAGGVLLPTGQVPVAGGQAHTRRPAFQTDDLRSSRSQVGCARWRPYHQTYLHAETIPM